MTRASEVGTRLGRRVTVRRDLESSATLSLGPFGSILGSRVPSGVIANVGPRGRDSSTGPGGWCSTGSQDRTRTSERH